MRLWLCLLWVSLSFAASNGEVDRIFAQFDKPQSPGCVVGVIRDGNLIFARGYGMANLEYSIPLDSKSVFEIASVSKQFTAMAVMLLAEQGKLSLDDPMVKHLPEYANFPREITLRHLLQHTSGIRDFNGLFHLAGYTEDHFYTNEDIRRMLSRQKTLNFDPGSQYLYSNSGYWLAAEVVARVTGMTLRAFTERYIFAPLGMRDTHFHDDHNEPVPRRATGYERRPDGRFRISMLNLDRVGPGGLYTTVEDLALWDANFYQPKVGAQALKEMQTPGTLTGGKPIDYGLGLRITRYRGLPVVVHTGARVGFRSILMRFPEQRFSVICLCNVAQANTTDLASRVADVYLAGLLKGPRPPAPAPPKRSPLTAPQEPFAGKYRSEELDVVYELGAEKGRVVIRRPAIPMGAISSMRFERDARGRIHGFLLSTPRGRDISFRRVWTRAELIEQLRESDAQFDLDTAAAGLEGWMKWFAPDAYLNLPGGVIRGKEALRGHYAKMFSRPGFSLRWKPLHAEVSANGDLGYTMGESVMRWQGEDGKPVERAGRYLTIWRRQADGAWAVETDAGN